MTNTRKYIKKNGQLLIVVVMLLFVGTCFIVLAENQINSQKAQMIGLQGIIKKNNDQINKLTSENASESAQVQALQNQPKPTPKIQYVTRYQTIAEPVEDTTTPTYNCYSDQIGGQYCNSDTGITMHCTSNYVGGMNCN